MISPNAVTRPVLRDPCTTAMMPMSAMAVAQTWRRWMRSPNTAPAKRAMTTGCNAEMVVASARVVCFTAKKNVQMSAANANAPLYPRRNEALVSRPPDA